MDDKKRQDFISRLLSPIRTESNHRAIADKLGTLESEYEKKVYNAPLIGNGAGMILFASSITSGKMPAEFLPMVIPSIWCFFLGVIASVLAGVFYIRNLSHWCRERIELGNSQDKYLDIYDSMRRFGFIAGKSASFDFSSATNGQIDTALYEIEEANRFAKRGARSLLIARVLIVFSGLLFVGAISIPLLKMSFQYGIS